MVQDEVLDASFPRQPRGLLGGEMTEIRGRVPLGLDIGRFDGQQVGAGHVVDQVTGADLLAIEATYVESERDTAADFGHLTAKQAAWLALEAGVKNLVLHHVSRRYSGKQIQEEAAMLFPETYVARDFDLFRLVKQKPLEREDVRGRAEADHAPAAG